MQTLVKASEEAVDELRQFKEEIAKQQTHMVNNINLINENMNNDVSKLRKTDTDLASQLEKIRGHLAEADSNVKNMERRLEACEKLSERTQLGVIDLTATKANLVDFTKNCKDVDKQLDELRKANDRTHVLALKLDRY